MTALVLGGAGSGKSAYAEALLCAASRGAARVYLATMHPSDDESLARVERHRALRAGKDFSTLERCRDLKGAELPARCALLLEDVGNLLSNEMFSPEGGDDAAEAVLDGIADLMARCETLVIVSNEVFSGGSSYGEGTVRYLSNLAYINRKLAAAADCVCAVSCGVAEFFKGSEAEFCSALTKEKTK